MPVIASMYYVYDSLSVGEGGSLVSPPATSTRKASSSLMSNKRRDSGIGLTKVKQVSDGGVGGCHFHFQLLHIQQGESGRAAVVPSSWCAVK